MSKKVKIGVLVVINLLLLTTTYSQSHKLKIGAKAPSITALKWIKGNVVTRFEKGQVYIVEFGATFCRPCKTAIPHLTKLSKKYGDKLTVIGFFVMENQSGDPTDISYVGKVEKYVDQMGDQMLYNVAVDDPRGTMAKNWLRGGIPQAYIVNREGVIAWSGNPNNPEMDTVLDKVIHKTYDLAFAIENYKKAEAAKTPYDRSKLLLIDGNGGEDTDFLFRSLLTKWKGDILAGGSNGNDYIRASEKYLNCGPDCREDHSMYTRAVQLAGFPLKRLYKIAYNDTVSPYPYTHPKIREVEKRSSYGEFWEEVIVEVSDPTPFLADFNSKDYRYNYSLMVPKEKASSKFLKKVMQSDLKNYFGYDVKVETRMMPYWKLIATKDYDTNKKIEMDEAFKKEYAEKFKSAQTRVVKDGNMYYLINHLYWLDQMDKTPFIDETNLSGGDALIEGNLKNLDGFRQALKEVGLDLVKSKKEMKVIVIRDPQN